MPRVLPGHHPYYSAEAAAASAAASAAAAAAGEPPFHGRRQPGGWPAAERGGRQVRRVLPCFFFVFFGETFFFFCPFGPCRCSRRSTRDKQGTTPLNFAGYEPAGVMGWTSSTLLNLVLCSFSLLNASPHFFGLQPQYPVGRANGGVPEQHRSSAAAWREEDADMRAEAAAAARRRSQGMWARVSGDPACTRGWRMNIRRTCVM